MNKILIITLIIYSSCLTSKYYTNCLDGAPIYDNKDHTVQECNKYNPEESYCCLLSFKIDEDVTSFSFNLGNFFRVLEEKEFSCIGITKDGYNKISDVIKEIEKESGVSKLKIDCNSKRLDIFGYLFYLLLFILI